MSKRLLLVASAVPLLWMGLPGRLAQAQEIPHVQEAPRKPPGHPSEGKEPERTDQDFQSRFGNGHLKVRLPRKTHKKENPSKKEGEHPDGPDAGEVKENYANVPGLILAGVFVAGVVGLGVWGKRKYYSS